MEDDRRWDALCELCLGLGNPGLCARAPSVGDRIDDGDSDIGDSVDRGQGANSHDQRIARVMLYQ